MIKIYASCCLERVVLTYTYTLRIRNEIINKILGESNFIWFYNNAYTGREDVEQDST